MPLIVCVTVRRRLIWCISGLVAASAALITRCYDGWSRATASDNERFDGPRVYPSETGDDVSGI